MFWWCQLWWQKRLTSQKHQKHAIPQSKVFFTDVFPKVVRRHELKPGDFIKRRVFCTWFLGLPDAEQANFLVSDEANFLLSGHVNTRNVVRYSLDRQGRPEDHAVEKVPYSPKIMAFCGMRTGLHHIFYFLGVCQKSYLRIRHLGGGYPPWFVNPKFVKKWNKNNVLGWFSSAKGGGYPFCKLCGDIFWCWVITFGG